jgi:hypothetical protein
LRKKIIFAPWGPRDTIKFCILEVPNKFYHRVLTNVSELKPKPFFEDSLSFEEPTKNLSYIHTRRWPRSPSPTPSSTKSCRPRLATAKRMPG